MATRVVYCAASYNSGARIFENASYATARTGPGNTSSAAFYIGQANAAGNYQVYQSFLRFDTSGYGSSVSSATLSMAIATNSSTTDFTIQARVGYDYPDPVNTGAGAWMAPADYGSYTTVATFATSGISGVGYNAFTDVALTANINLSGNTKLSFISDRTVSNTTPTTDEYILGKGQGYDLPAKLTFTDASTQNSQSLTTGGTGTFTPTVTGLHDVESWGGGAKATGATNQEPGSNGGSYGWGQYNVTSLSGISYNVGLGITGVPSSGGDTWWASNTGTSLGASGGNGTTGGSSPNNYTNIVEFDGGQGAAAQGGGGSRAGSGGGSSAGTASNGANGTAGSGNTPGTGGTAPTGGGNGGNGGNSGASGQAGTAPGGGGGGGGNSGGNVGNGADGKIIVYWFVFPAAKALPPFAPTLPFQHMIMR